MQPPNFSVARALLRVPGARRTAARHDMLRLRRRLSDVTSEILSPPTRPRGDASMAWTRRTYDIRLRDLVRTRRLLPFVSPPPARTVRRVVAPPGGAPSRETRPARRRPRSLSPPAPTARRCASRGLRRPARARQRAGDQLLVDGFLGHRHLSGRTLPIGDSQPSSHSDRPPLARAPIAPAIADRVRRLAAWCDVVRNGREIGRRDLAVAECARLRFHRCKPIPLRRLPA